MSMPRRIFTHDHPDRCVIGTVGEPGDRAFFLQVRSAGQRHAVAIDKQQAQLLAERIDDLLDDLVDRDLVPAVDAQLRADLLDDEPLEAPIQPNFRSGVLGLGWNRQRAVVVIEAFDAGVDSEQTPDLESDSTDGPDTLRIRLDPDAAREFVRRSRMVVAAGLPTCPFCQLSLDPDGHICPRANGYRR
jgi:uncharacterized repeat protein (TIGR03847 family)